MPPHPSLRDTFSPKAKALMWLHLCLYKGRLYGTFPGDVSTALRMTELNVCFILRVSIMDALDHEGWAVGVAVLWGYLPKW